MSEKLHTFVPMTFLPSVLCLCATCGRHTLLERAVRFFLDQDYEGQHTLLIYNNSDVQQCMDELYLPNNKQILLINNHIDSKTSLPYTSLGAIYNDILTFLRPDSYDVVVHFDDDDIYLPTHISAGIQGLEKGGKKAYKPAHSYYRNAEGIELSKNVFEPSIFVLFSHLLEKQYSLKTTEQHLQWLDPLKLEDSIFVDKEGTPTLIYNWGDTEISTYKSSGDFHNPNNFNNYRIHSKDHGDHLITPWEAAQVIPYYKQIENVKS